MLIDGDFEMSLRLKTRCKSNAQAVLVHAKASP